MTNYSRGANFERRVKKHMEDAGWICFRSAGSHSPADLVCLKAIPPIRGLSRMGLGLLIQCQLDKGFNKNKKEGLIDLSIATGAFPLLCWRDKSKIMFEYAESK